MIKSEGGNGWREREMLNYEVTVRKPIWQGVWKTEAYRIQCSAAVRSPSSSVSSSSRTQWQGEGQRTVHRGNHPELRLAFVFFLFLVFFKVTLL